MKTHLNIILNSSPCPQVFGGLVWILVASTHVDPPNPLGWVMFVSIFCFVMTFLWMIIFISGCHKNSSGWAAAVRAKTENKKIFVRLE